jgi:hypothetical protein
MTDTYPYGGSPDGEEVGEIGEGAGACPPDEKWYRIYPEFDFNEIFGNPPSSVTT